VFPQEEGNAGGRNQNNDQEILELPEKDGPRRDFFRRGQLVGTVLLQAVPGLGGAQPGGAGVEDLQHLLGRQRIVCLLSRFGLSALRNRHGPSFRNRQRIQRRESIGHFLWLSNRQEIITRSTSGFSINLNHPHLPNGIPT
jgi:hypothetical protein